MVIWTIQDSFGLISGRAEGPGLTGISILINVTQYFAQALVAPPAAPVLSPQESQSAWQYLLLLGDDSHLRKLLSCHLHSKRHPFIAEIVGYLFSHLYPYELENAIASHPTHSQRILERCRHHAAQQ